MAIRLEQLKDMEDTEILALIRSDSTDSTIAMDFFLEKYKGLVLHQARSLYLVGGDRDDLLQEGKIGRAHV